MSAEQRLRELGLELPEPAPVPATILGARRSGRHLHLSGHGPVRPDGSLVTGRVGDDVDLEQAREAARLTAVQMLATTRAVLGSLDAVGTVVKLLGMVQCAPGFDAPGAVVNGCSELLVDIFGEAGRHGRSAIGVAVLPGSIVVEIEGVLEIDEREVSDEE